MQLGNRLKKALHKGTDNYFNMTSSLETGGIRVVYMRYRKTRALHATPKFTFSQL